MVFVNILIKAEGNPTYHGLGDGSLQSEEIALVIFLTFYLIYFTALMIKSSMKFESLAQPFKFLFVLTNVVAVLSIAALFAGFYTPFQSSVVFLTFYGLANLYVWTLAYCFMPVDEDSNRLHSLHDEHEREYMTSLGGGMGALSSDSSHTSKSSSGSGSGSGSGDDDDIEIELNNRIPSIPL